VTTADEQYERGRPTSIRPLHRSIIVDSKGGHQRNGPARFEFADI
jgi:hypothetical protein